MRLKFYCPRWGSEDLPWNQFFEKVKADGYDGVEIGFPFTLEASEQKEILDGLRHFNLEVIGQHWQTVNSDFEAHQAEYKQHLLSLAKLNPLFINTQTGKDFFSIEQNLALMAITDEVTKETGVKILHETHRGKWSFAAHIAQQYLEAAPKIRITLDISHWFNVAESFLEDQQDVVQLAIQHADHLHARVGFQEGPQVIEPRAPENEETLNVHLKVWDELVALKQKNGDEYFTITPEYGAPPYQQLLPFSKQPIASQWDINVWMKDLLKKRYFDLAKF